MARDIKDVVDELVAIVSMERDSFINLIPDKSRPTLVKLRHLDVSHILEGDDYFFLTDGTPEVVWPVKVGLAVKQESGQWVFQVVRSVTAKQLRGRVNIVAPRMLALDIVQMRPDGRCVGVNEYAAWVNKRWVDAAKGAFKRHHDTAGNMPHYKGEAESFHIKCGMMIGHALRHRYEWSVSVGEPGGPSFRFATDATGIRQMLNERDKGATGRRDALRGWVVDHWRQSRHDPEMEVYVRKHLRGGETFTWRGYECDWRPSDFDKERNEAFRAERELMGLQARRLSPEPPADGSGGSL